MRHHGIELDGEKAHLRFGMLRLVERLNGPTPSDPPRPEWTRANGFTQAVGKFRDTYWKFDRVAKHVHDCHEAIRTFATGRLSGEFVNASPDDPDLLAFFDATTDLPIYLDSLLLYLRIQVDAFAALARPFFQGKDVPMDFRKQVNWFRKKRDLDPGYTRIVDQPLEWFEKLSGKDTPKGLREHVVHYFGTYQMSWLQSETGDWFELTPSMVRAKGMEVVERNVLKRIGEISFGWMDFLDKCLVHFVDRLSSQDVVDVLQVDGDQTRVASYSVNDMPSAWVYPKWSKVELVASGNQEPSGG